MVEHKLNLPASKARRFIDYLNSELRPRIRRADGFADIHDDGTLETVVTGSVSFKDKVWAVSIRIEKSPDGRLDKIEAWTEDYDADETEWEREFHEFVVTVLSRAFSDSNARYTWRTSFNYIGPRLHGEYWLPGRWRVAPLQFEDDAPAKGNAERIVVFDFKVDAIDEHDAERLAAVQARRQSARVSFLLNRGLYSPAGEHRWVLDHDLNEHRRLQFAPRLHERLASMPKKGALCKLGEYRHSVMNQPRSFTVFFPEETRKVLSSVETTPKLADAFDSCARLHQIALVVGAYMPSLAAAYRVAAIDAVARAGGMHFGDFVRKHASPRPNLETIIDHLHGSVRSAHFHGGRFPWGEFERREDFDPFLDPTTLERDTLHVECNRVLREVIGDWLLEISQFGASKTK